MTTLPLDGAPNHKHPICMSTAKTSTLLTPYVRADCAVSDGVCHSWTLASSVAVQPSMGATDFAAICLETCSVHLFGVRGVPGADFRDTLHWTHVLLG